MTFLRVDEQTVKCVIDFDEMEEMGFDKNDIVTDGQNMQNFLQQIMEAAEENGFHLNENIQHVECCNNDKDSCTLLFTKMDTDTPINKAIDQMKLIANMVNSITVDRLDEIRAMTGKEKYMEYNHCMDNYMNGLESNNSIAEHTKKHGQTMVSFDDLDDICFFAKAMNQDIMCDLYKYNNRFYVILNKELTEKEEKAMLLTAIEYNGTKVFKVGFSTFLEENGEHILCNQSLLNLAKVC